MSRTTRDARAREGILAHTAVRAFDLAADFLTVDNWTKLNLFEVHVPYREGFVRNLGGGWNCASKHFERFEQLPSSGCKFCAVGAVTFRLATKSALPREDHVEILERLADWNDTALTEFNDGARDVREVKRHLRDLAVTLANMRRLPPRRSPPLAESARTAWSNLE